MSDSLFPEDEAPAPPPKRKRGSGVEPATPKTEWLDLRAKLPPQLRLGTSSWNYPGWIDTVWAQEYSESTLSKQGLRAYAQNPLLRTVSLDRAFYKPLNAGQYSAYAAQIPEDFRFVVKAPSLVADALVRDEGGHAMMLNPNFLDPELAVREFAQPAMEGLRDKLGVLIFQLSPMPDGMLRDLSAFFDRLGAMLRALPRGPVIAVEVRNAQLVRPELAALLRSCGATYALGLHAKLPPIEEQLPLLRALWPSPLVCRWNLHRMHGAYGYEDAKRKYGDFDKLVDPDPETRAVLARVIAGTTGAGHAAYVTLGNKAEGSAPLSALELARSVCAQRSD